MTNKSLWTHVENQLPEYELNEIILITNYIKKMTHTPSVNCIDI